jgi:hydrogenase/urease accessory protein HupE
VSRALGSFLLLVLAAPLAEAHEVRPGYLELRQTDAEAFDVLWKVPARGGRRLALEVRLPEASQPVSPTLTSELSGAYADRWSVRCPGGLAGQRIEIAGLPQTVTDVLVRIEWADGTTQIERLTPASPSCQVAVKPSASATAATYLVLGVEHILLGVDHLLFVLALLLLVEGWRKLLGTITAFTVAHSVTLGLASLGLVHVPPRPVEAVIALSVVFLAAEILRQQRGLPGLTQRQPWVAAFAFGLLHGLGFAGALSEVGLPAHAIPLALLTFNVGVELGQIAFVAVALGALRLLTGRERPARLAQIVAYAIGALATFWLLERTTSFWT